MGLDFSDLVNNPQYFTAIDSLAAPGTPEAAVAAKYVGKMFKVSAQFRTYVYLDKEHLTRNYPEIISDFVDNRLIGKMVLAKS